MRVCEFFFKKISTNKPRSLSGVFLCPNLTKTPKKNVKEMTMTTAQNDNDRVIIFDTTLRDGEQSPGCTMNSEQKLKVAHQLAAMGVDVIEAGFAAASPGDFESIHTIAQEVKGSTICSLARATEGDIRAAGEAIKPAESGRIHTFIATSPIHMEHKLQMTSDQVVERAVQAVKWAKEYTDDVEFSLEDGFRSEFDFICRVTEAAITAGATTINIPDTVGYGDPEQYGDMFRRVIATVPNADKAIFSVHCHNDLGMATANSMAGIHNGARQIECTVNGIGERAGNTALEEVVMAIKTRKDFGFYTNIDTTKIVPSSQLVSSVTGSPVQPNKAIVGANAFAHESGIHQDGVLKNRETYEIMRAQDVGLTDNSLVMGKHSGRAAVFDKLEKLGFDVPQEDRADFFRRFKDLADRKSEIYDNDLIALHLGAENTQGAWELQGAWARSVYNVGGEAEIILAHNGKEPVTVKSHGDGPLNAAFKAIKDITGFDEMVMKTFQVEGVSPKSDAQGMSSIRVEYGRQVFQGSGVDTDSTFSAIKAMVDVVNQIEFTQSIPEIQKRKVSVG